MEFADIISRLRAEKGLTQAKLAEKCGVDESTVGKWEYKLRKNIYFDSITKLADAFDVSTDVFRPDNPGIFDLPHPHFEQRSVGEEKSEPLFEDVPLRFGSTVPNERQAKILRFCKTYLDGLDKSHFTRGAGQNSEYGTGIYFYESKIDLLLWIGFTPDMQQKNPRCAFSIAINTEIKIPDEELAAFDAVCIPDGEGENWVYIPIKHPITSTFETELPGDLKKASDEALFSAMGIARKALDKSMRQFKSERKSI